MIKVMCSLCNRVKSETVEDHIVPVTISHSFCAKCVSTDEGQLGISVEKILNPDNSKDEDVIETIGFIKDSIKAELDEGVVWLGEEKEYSSAQEQLFDKYLKEVETEIMSEAARERGKLR